MKILITLAFLVAANAGLFGQDFLTASKRAQRLVLDGKAHAYREASREDGIFALGILGGEENLQFLVSQLDRFHDESHVRSQIIAAIRTSRSKSANRRLLDLAAKDPEAQVRSDGIAALGATKDPAVVAALEGLFGKEKNEDVAKALGNALEEITGLEYPEEVMPASFSSFQAYLLFTRGGSYRAPDSAAEKMLLDAAALSPQTAEIWNALGKRFTRKDAQKALRYFEKAAALSPSWEEPLFSMGDLYLEGGHYDKADTSFQRAKKLCSTDACRDNADSKLKMLEIFRRRDQRPTAYN